MDEKQREQARIRKQRQRDKERDIGGCDISNVTWETIPLEDIRQALPQDIVDYIENVASRYGLREQRLRRAYKYHLWHKENFINGVHKDLVEATR